MYYSYTVIAAKISLLVVSSAVAGAPASRRLFCFYKLFYFFHFFSNPFEISLRINFFGNVRDFMTDYVFDGVLINAIFLSRCDEMLSGVVQSMCRVQI